MSGNVCNVYPINTFNSLLQVLGKTLTMLITGSSVPGPIPNLEDDDVKAERTRVTCEIQKLTKESAVVVSGLRKKYGSKVAVQNLTLGTRFSCRLYFLVDFVVYIGCIYTF